MSCHRSALEMLHRRGVRLTPQRSLILEDLYHHAGHRTAEEIYGSVSSQLPGLNRATVYRTLELFREAHVVTTSLKPGGSSEFELVRAGDEPHHHLRCRRCGVEIDFDAEPVEALKREILNSCGFQADLDHLMITGLCADCSTRSDHLS